MVGASNQREWSGVGVGFFFLAQTHLLVSLSEFLAVLECGKAKDAQVLNKKENEARHISLRDRHGHDCARAR